MGSEIIFFGGTVAVALMDDDDGGMAAGSFLSSDICCCCCVCRYSGFFAMISIGSFPSLSAVVIDPEAIGLSN